MLLLPSVSSAQCSQCTVTGLQLYYQGHSFEYYTPILGPQPHHWYPRPQYQHPSPLVQPRTTSQPQPGPVSTASLTELVTGAAIAAAAEVTPSINKQSGSRVLHRTACLECGDR